MNNITHLTRKLLSKRFGHSYQIADEISAAVWNEMKSKDVRDVLSIAKLVHSIEDVSWLVRTFRKYGSITGRSKVLHEETDLHKAVIQEIMED